MSKTYEGAYLSYSLPYLKNWVRHVLQGANQKCFKLVSNGYSGKKKRKKKTLTSCFILLAKLQKHISRISFDTGFNNTFSIFFSFNFVLYSCGYNQVLFNAVAIIKYYLNTISLEIKKYFLLGNLIHLKHSLKNNS